MENPIQNIDYETIHHCFPDLKIRSDELLDVEIINCGANTVLLDFDQVAKYFWFVRDGCVRASILTDDAREITVQFILENQMVGSLESALRGVPSSIRLETIEQTQLTRIAIADWILFVSQSQERERVWFQFIEDRLIFYSQAFIALLVHSPEARYLRFARERQDLLNRIPHHYIASYLGITPVSLSRIRSRVAKRRLTKDND